MITLQTNGLYPPPVELLLERIEKLTDHYERQDRKLSLTYIAGTIGKSSATVSHLLNHKDTGNVEDTVKRLQAFVEREEAKLTNGLLAIPFCETRQAKTVRQAVRFAHRFQRMVAVIGPSGLGKSRTFQELKQDDPSLLVIRASVIHGASGVLKDICDEIKVYDVGTQRALYKRIKARLASSGRCLIVDDVHDLSLKSLHLLRTLFDDLEIGVVLSGITTLRRWLTGTSDELEQLASRVAGRIWELPSFNEQDLTLLLSAVMKTDDVEAGLALFKQDPRLLGSARRIAYALEVAGRSSEKQHGKGSKVTLRHLAEAIKRAEAA